MLERKRGGGNVCVSKNNGIITDMPVSFIWCQTKFRVDLDSSFFRQVFHLLQDRCFNGMLSDYSPLKKSQGTNVPHRFKNIFSGIGVGCSLWTHPLQVKKKAFPPFFWVAFQQGSVHCITKLLRGFQNMSKACWGLPKTAARAGRLWEGLGLHQVDVCAAAASWCINAPHARFTLSVLGLSIPASNHWSYSSCQSHHTTLVHGECFAATKILHLPAVNHVAGWAVEVRMITQTNHDTRFMTLQPPHLIPPIRCPLSIFAYSFPR